MLYIEKDIGGHEMTSQRTRAAANAASADGANIFWTALRLIGRGFVEIAQGIGLIAEGTLRPVRSFVPSFVALASIAALTTVTLVGIITTVAHADLQASPAQPGVTWARWSTSPEIRFGDRLS